MIATRYDSWFFHAWEHLRIILTGFMKEREREWVGMSYFIPSRDCGCMESRNTGTILSLNPFAWCCSWQESRPLQACLHLWAAEAERLGTVFLLILPPLMQQLGRWFPGVLCRVQEAGEFLNGPWLQPDKNWTGQMITGEGLMQPLTWKQMKWCRGPQYGNLDSDAADGPSSFGVGWCYQTIALGKSIVGEEHCDNSVELSCNATCHFIRGPWTEHVMMDDWIASGAVVWVEVEKISCTKGLRNCDWRGCGGPKVQLWWFKDGTLLCTYLFLHARNQATDDQ